MKSNLQTVIDFLKIQIEGEPVPPAGSVAWNELEHAIREIQIHNSTNEQAMLGLLVMNVVIDRVRASLGAQAALQKFIRGNDHV